MGNHPGARVAGGVASLAVTLLGFVTVAEVARQTRATALERGLPAWSVLLGALAVASIVVAGWLLWLSQGGATAGLAAVAAGLFVPVWAGITGLSPSARAAALAAAPLATAGAAHVALGWAPGSRRARRALVAVYGCAVAGALIHLAGYNPFDDPGCARTCVDASTLAGDHLATATVRRATAALTVMAGGIALVAVVRARGDHAPRLVRAGGTVAILLLAIAAVLEVPVQRSRGPSDVVRVVLPATAGLAVGAPGIVVGLRLRRVRVAVDRLLRGLSNAGPDGSRTGVQFAIPGGGGWVDAAGGRVRNVDSGGLVVADGEGPVLRLASDVIRDDDGVLADQSRATWLSLRNAQLAAVTRARVADVRTSQRRVCAASDIERQRIERDLHDGAQQRLVSAAFHLSLARARLSSDDERIERAEGALRDALVALRRLTHGLFPSLLAREGLRAALDELVREVRIPTTVAIDRDHGLGPDAAMAAYATVAAALEHVARSPGATCGHVAVDRRDGLILVTVTAEGVATDRLDPNFADVDDRIGALGGSLRLDWGNGTTTVTAEIPCES